MVILLSFSNSKFLCIFAPSKNNSLKINFKMKKLFVIGLCVVMSLPALNVKAQNNMTQEQKISYALGAANGEQLHQVGLTAIDLQIYMQGMQDAMNGANKLSQQEMQEMFQIIQQRVQELQSKGANEEKERGQFFLEENKKNKDVQVTPSGLQYKVITMGQGVKPAATDRVKVHYHGTTIDGIVFDSSVKRGEPTTFGLNQVIPGWTEGLQLMPEGSKFIFYIPSELAYGDRGAGADIKPGATLIFEVELLEVNPK
jgi:FKBP-type peptidyl-prolyl cis-trans isomerase